MSPVRLARTDGLATGGEPGTLTSVLWLLIPLTIGLAVVVWAEVK